MTGELVDTDMSGKQRAARLHKLPSTSYRVTDSLNFLKLRHKEAKDFEAVVSSTNPKNFMFHVRFSLCIVYLRVTSDYSAFLLPTQS